MLVHLDLPEQCFEGNHETEHALVNHTSICETMPVAKQ
jgi:hypothetical protein